jgi:spore maturation protein CgeB
MWTRALIHKVGMKKRREVVSQVIGPGGSVFGDEGWRDILGQNLYGGEIVYGDHLREIYNGSAFVLDIRQPQSRTGLTQRIFDASACGVPVLTEWSPEMESLFNPGEEVFWFHNLDSALKIKERILQDPQDARKKGKRAKHRILSQHTYRHRAQVILEALRQF